MANAQLPCQEGDLPSRSMPSAPPPPPPAPERTWPQRGSQTKSALRDPMRLAANFRSSGWRKDLEHILRVYYMYSVELFMEGDWFRMKERFFDHFLRHKKAALEVKEARPLPLWPTSKTSFIRLPASTSMASGASHVGSRRGAIITG